MSRDQSRPAAARTRTLMVVLAVALIAAACGGGDSEESGAVSATTGDASADTDAESTAATTGVTSTAGEGADSAYCLLSAAGYVEGDALSDLNLPAEEFNRRTTEAALAELDEMVAAAPDDLPVDIEVFAGLFREYAAALELVGWNVDNLDEAGNELTSELFDVVFELAVYDGEVCGVGDFAD